MACFVCVLDGAHWRANGPAWQAFCKYLKHLDSI